MRPRRLVIFYLKCAAYKSTYLLTYLPSCQNEMRSSEEVVLASVDTVCILFLLNDVVNYRLLQRWVALSGTVGRIIRMSVSSSFSFSTSVISWKVERCAVLRINNPRSPSSNLLAQAGQNATRDKSDGCESAKDDLCRRHHPVLLGAADWRRKKPELHEFDWWQKF